MRQMTVSHPHPFFTSFLSNLFHDFRTFHDLRSLARHTHALSQWLSDQRYRFEDFEPKSANQPHTQRCGQNRTKCSMNN